MSLTKGNIQARQLVNQQANRCLDLSVQAIIAPTNHETLETLKKEFVRLNTMGTIGSALDQMEKSGLMDDETQSD